MSSGARLVELRRLLPMGMSDPATAVYALRDLVRFGLEVRAAPAGDGMTDLHLQDGIGALERFLVSMIGCARTAVWDEASRWVEALDRALADLGLPDDGVAPAPTPVPGDGEEGADVIPFPSGRTRARHPSRSAVDPSRVSPSAGPLEPSRDAS